jgi:hypothetical protein
MLMFYTRAITVLSVFNKKSFIFNNIKYRNFASAVYDNRYTYYEDEDDTTAMEPQNMCFFCKGTRFIRCNQCKSGCTNCNFTEMIPCPFCNNSGGTAIASNNTLIPAFIRRHQYRVPF